ncbi:hypothetical protein ACLKA7_003253 [Drosophila subpalustris]
MELCASPRKNFLMDRNTERSFKKGRRDDWQNEVHKSQRNGNLQFNYGDRFIPKRFNSDNIDCNQKYLETNEEKDILRMNFSMTCKYWRQNTMMTAINNAFGLRSSRLLQFSNIRSHLAELYRRTNIDGDWPCAPRPRPLAYANATHEMPEICVSFSHNLMDWSINGQMAVSFGQDVIVWHNELETTMVYSVKNPGALKYSPNGRYLALSCSNFKYPVLELWKLQPAQEFLVINGKYFQKWIKSIRCIEWSNDSERIVCGTECGLIVILSTCTLRTLHKIRKHNHKIRCIRYSPNGQYLATADTQGHIYIFHSKQYKVFMCFRTKSGEIAFDWHPWSGVDLAISEKSPPSIYIFHVPRREMVAYYQRANKKIQICSINFSKITGELLVNVYRYDNNGCLCCEILVLSSLNRVVDIVGHQERNLFFMMWSPDGSKLAAAGLDESFSIWNFYPKDKIDVKAKNKSCDVKKRSSLELYTLFK